MRIGAVKFHLHSCRRILGYLIAFSVTATLPCGPINARMNDAASGETRGTTSQSNASARRASVLHYLKSLSAQYNHGILSGQWFSGPSGWPRAYELFVKTLTSATGKTPAILASQYELNIPSETPRQAPPAASSEKNSVLDQILERHSQFGGLVSLTWLLDNPWYRLGRGEQCQSAPKPCVPGSLTELMRTDNPAGAYLKAEMDQMATHLQSLQTAGVVVLFRPFHEMNGGWFWWGAQSATAPTPGEFAALWRYVYDYFAKKKGLSNIIWIYSPGNAELNLRTYPWGIVQPPAYYYPGSDYVDIVGIDYYRDRLGPPTNASNASKTSIPSYKQLIALGKPFGIAELGPGNPASHSFDFDAIIHELSRDYAQAIFFVAWQDGPGKFYSIINNPAPEKLMHDPLVLTRDDIRY